MLSQMKPVSRRDKYEYLIDLVDQMAHLAIQIDERMLAEELLAVLDRAHARDEGWISEPVDELDVRAR